MASGATARRGSLRGRGSDHRVEPLLLEIVDGRCDAPPQIGADKIASSLQIENALSCALGRRLATRLDTLSRQAINIGIGDHHTHIL